MRHLKNAYLMFRQNHLGFGAEISAGYGPAFPLAGNWIRDPESLADRFHSNARVASEAAERCMR